MSALSAWAYPMACWELPGVYTHVFPSPSMRSALHGDVYCANYLGASSSGHLLAPERWHTPGAQLSRDRDKSVGLCADAPKEMMLEAAMGSTRRGVHCFSGRAVEQTCGGITSRAYD